MTTRAVNTVIMTLVAALLISCSREPEGSGPQFGGAPSLPSQGVYHFAVHPLHNPAKLIEAYQPLVDYLNAHLQEGHLELEASRDYARFEEKYARRDPEFLLPNPLQSLQAMEVGYRVIAMAGEPADFTGIFVVRRDSGLTVPTDLKGKAVSYPSATALAACIMPQYFLHTHGVDVNEDIDNQYVGSQESSIMNAYLGLTAVGATWPTPWRAFQKEHPEEAAQLMVIWETEPLINNSVMVRNDVPPEVADKVAELLLELDETEEGISILGRMETARFLPATDMDYDVVRDYVARFEAEVRRVGGP
ncbi:MAG: PhnD/SsuA/transferrin family substrate-binding protein [Gammaproteobacteria bacterium]|nr:PhnD/SsuA/transferrin family substrate-binding protein [Gammaproteobacteria bacterium]